ncbi:MAG: helix-turn-helix domain-containing protein [Chitinophagaceae bacterium]|nr:helix-turn-helix domain-containing protein [Chitinophagaceae bacterium]
MVIHIKNMVCDRCIMSVRRQLDQLGMDYKNVQLGQVELSSEPTKDELNSLKSGLEEQGFELLDDKRSQVVEKIKNTIITLIHRSDGDDFNLKMSAHLEEAIGLDYHYLSTLFSSVEGLTIERYTILQRIERVKELVMYNEKNLSEIAFELGYSSVQHLSQQFKKVTGLTPSAFKELGEKRRKPIDRISD